MLVILMLRLITMQVIIVAYMRLHRVSRKEQKVSDDAFYLEVPFTDGTVYLEH